MQINFDAVEKDVKGRLFHNECSKEYSAGAMDALSIVKLHGYERPTGEWIFRKGVTYGGYYKCDKCGKAELAKMNYCPNCGAKMTKEAENE